MQNNAVTEKKNSQKYTYLKLYSNTKHKYVYLESITGNFYHFLSLLGTFLIILLAQVVLCLLKTTIEYKSMMM